MFFRRSLIVALEQYLYAINVTPIEQMDDVSLNEHPADTTDSPLISQIDERGARAAANAPNTANARKRPATGMSGFVKSGADTNSGDVASTSIVPPTQTYSRFGNVSDNNGNQWSRDGGERPQSKRRKPVGPCWFCLNSPQVEKHLIVSVGSECYVALAKGGLVEEHLLIVAIEHVPSFEALSPTAKEECRKYKHASTSFNRL